MARQKPEGNRNGMFFLDFKRAIEFGDLGKPYDFKFGMGYTKKHQKTENSHRETPVKFHWWVEDVFSKDVDLGVPYGNLT